MVNHDTELTDASYRIREDWLTEYPLSVPVSSSQLYQPVSGYNGIVDQLLTLVCVSVVSD